MPKVMKKVIRRHLVEHAKTMAGTVREAYGEVPGRVQGPPFSERGEKASAQGSRNGLGTIFYDFGCTLGVPGGTIFREKRVFFPVRFPGPIPELWGGWGPAAVVPGMGRGIPFRDIPGADVRQGDLIRLAAGLRPGAADLKASPLPPAPF